ncbi:MAG TPA: ISAs1 family transposase [Ktedonobacteraceae bacterium]
MNYTRWQEALTQGEITVEVDAQSVYRAFEQVIDGRHKRGVRYSVALLLTLIVLAKLAGMTTPLAIAEGVRLRAKWLREVLPTTRESFPCAATYSKVLRAGNAEQVNQVLTEALTRIRAPARCGEEPSRLAGQAQREEHVHVALDGKTLRGTLGHEQPDQKKMHQLGLYETKTGLLLKEQVTGEKQKELSIVSQFLTPLWVKGRIISADALHTQHLCCASVTRWEGDYVLIAKGNQPILRDDLQLFFSEPPADCRDWRTARTVDKGHGRLEIRELVTSTELNDFLAGQWAGVAQVFRLTRTVHEDGKTRIEVVYGIASLSPAHASAARLLDLVRDHWAIENRLHWRRDVTLREDHCQVRKGEAPRVLAVLNSFLLALLDFLGVSNVPKQMRIFDAQPLLAVRLLLGSLLTFK